MAIITSSARRITDSVQESPLRGQAPSGSVPVPGIRANDKMQITSQSSAPIADLFTTTVPNALFSAIKANTPGEAAALRQQFKNETNPAHATQLISKWGVAMVRIKDSAQRRKEALAGAEELREKFEFHVTNNTPRMNPWKIMNRNMRQYADTLMIKLVSVIAMKAYSTVASMGILPPNETVEGAKAVTARFKDGGEIIDSALDTADAIWTHAPNKPALMFMAEAIVDELFKHQNFVVVEKAVDLFVKMAPNAPDALLKKALARANHHLQNGVSYTDSDTGAVHTLTSEVHKDAYNKAIRVIKKIIASRVNP